MGGGIRLEFSFTPAMPQPIPKSWEMTMGIRRSREVAGADGMERCGTARRRGEDAGRIMRRPQAAASGRRCGTIPSERTAKPTKRKSAGELQWRLPVRLPDREQLCDA
jgi:hypothetical protein